MALLAEYAITPDVFDASSYTHPDACDAELRSLKEVLMSEGLVRDLRSGAWRRVFQNDERSWHLRGKELLKKLAQQGRLVTFEPVLDSAPTDDLEWCREALGTAAVLRFTGGVIVTEAVKNEFGNEPVVARVDRLANAPWWTARSSSVRITRTMDEYRRHLDPALRYANSLMFIDPHLDPARRQYREFAQLLEAVGERSPAPSIEIHRVCWKESRDKRVDSDFIRGLEIGFRKALESVAEVSGLRVQVFLWDGFHDRYLISNLIGISLPNGFDTTSDLSNITRWTRLGRSDRDDIQREFDPASHCHELREQFLIE